MAKIPDATALGERVVADGRRNYTPDRSAEILNNANAAIESIGNAAQRYAQQDDAFNFARAQTALQSADAALEKKLAEDSDWATHESRYTEEMKKAREDAAKLIRGSRSRALFENGAQTGIEHGAAKIRAQAKQVEGQWGRSTLDELLETNRRAALETKDPALRAALERATNDAIVGAISKQFIAPDVGKNLSQAWSQAYGEGYVNVQPPAEQLRLLRDPKGTPADRIDPSKRADMLAVAEHNDKVQRVEAVAGTIAAAFERDTVEGQVALKDLAKSDLTDAEKFAVRSQVRQAQGLIHAERRQEFSEQVNGLERRISSGAPGPNAELDAGRLYRKGVYTPEQYTNILERIDAARAKGAEDEASISAISAAMASGARLDPKNTKVVAGVDKWFKQVTADARIEPGSDEWVNGAAEIAAKSNILPPAAMSWARSNLLSGDAKLSVPAANAMTRWSEAAPAAYAYFDDTNMKAFAEQLDGMVRAGAKPEEATKIAHDNVYTMPKERRDRLNNQYKGGKHAASNAEALTNRMDADDNFDRSYGPGGAPDAGGAGIGARAMGEEYELLVRSYYDKTNGDISAARDLAWKDIRGTYGYSTVNGKPEILKYAPELVFPGIDTNVIREDIAASLGAKTWDGYPAVKNNDGTFSTRLTATVTDPALNGGKPTNIPTIWKGKKVSEAEAVRAAAASDQKWPAFASIEEATAAAKKVSDDIGTAAIDPKTVRLVPSRDTGDTRGLMWQLQTVDEDGHAEVLRDAQNRPVRYAIPTDTETYVKAQEDAKRKAVDAARAESKRRRDFAEGRLKIGAY